MSKKKFAGLTTDEAGQLVTLMVRAADVIDINVDYDVERNGESAESKADGKVAEKLRRTAKQLGWAG